MMVDNYIIASILITLIVVVSKLHIILTQSFNTLFSLICVDTINFLFILFIASTRLITSNKAGEGFLHIFEDLVNGAETVDLAALAHFIVELNDGHGLVAESDKALL